MRPADAGRVSPSAETAAAINTTAKKERSDPRVRMCEFPPSSSLQLGATSVNENTLSLASSRSQKTGKPGRSATCHLNQNLDNVAIPVCFTGGDTPSFDSLELDIKAIGAEFDVNRQTEVGLGPFQNCAASTTTTTTTTVPV